MTKVGNFIFNFSGKCCGIVDRIQEEEVCVIPNNRYSEAEMAGENWLSIAPEDFTPSKMLQRINVAQNKLSKYHLDFAVAENDEMTNEAIFHYNRTAKYLQIIINIYNNMIMFYNIQSLLDAPISDEIVLHGEPMLHDIPYKPIFCRVPLNITDYPLQCLDDVAK